MICEAFFIENPPEKAAKKVAKLPLASPGSALKSCHPLQGWQL